MLVTRHVVDKPAVVSEVVGDSPV